MRELTDMTAHAPVWAFEVMADVIPYDLYDLK